MSTQSFIPPNINYNKNMADVYSPFKTYPAGSLCIKDNILYKANQDISTAEPWTPAHWDATTIAEALSELNGKIQNGWTYLGSGSGTNGTAILSNFSEAKYKDFLIVPYSSSSNAKFNVMNIPRQLIEIGNNSISNVPAPGGYDQAWIKVLDDVIYACTYAPNSLISECRVYAK